jgi:hypothetical protein
MRPKWWLVISAVVISGISAYYLREIVRVYILTPFILLTRIERILFAAIPQVIFWILFLVVGLFFITRSFSSRKYSPRNRPNPEENWDSRARQLSKWIKTSRKSEYSKWVFARSVCDLTINILMYHEQLPASEISQRIQRGVISLPAEVRNFILTTLELPSFRHYSESKEYWRRNFQASPLDIDPLVMIEFLESQI